MTDKNKYFLIVLASLFYVHLILYREYRFFHENVQKVLVLQNAYHNYVHELQRVLHDHSALKGQLDACQTDIILENDAIETEDVQVTDASDKVKFMWPLEQNAFWLSSYFGPRKKPGGGTKFHYGIDMAALKGTPVYAAADGKVIEAEHARGYGNTIIVKHNETYQTRYAHLHKILVTVGDQVKKGDCIGQVGDTGSVRKSGSDASHLHFEVYVAGKKMDPMRYLS